MNIDTLPWKQGNDKDGVTNSGFDWVYMYDPKGLVYTVIKRRDDNPSLDDDGTVYAIDTGTMRALAINEIWRADWGSRPSILDLMCAIEHFQLTLERRK